MKRPHFLLVCLEKFSAPAQKHQSPLVQYTDAGSEEQRLPNVVGDEQRRLPECVPQMKDTAAAIPHASPDRARQTVRR